MNDMLDIQDWMKLQTHKVKSNIAVVDNTEGKGPPLYHITYDRDPGKFTPIIGHRQAYSEDRSVPRICVSSTIVGTILGHSAFEDKSVELEVNKKDGHGVVYHGGFYLFEFPYKVAVRPNEKLVYDQDVSDEHWLVTYNKDTVYYKPELVGVVIPTEISTTLSASKKPQTSVIYYIKVDKDIPFSKTKVLSPGFYKVRSPASRHIEAWDKADEVKVTRIREADFNEKKKEVTVMETASVTLKNPPLFSKW